MEDLDRARVIPGCDADILRTLEMFGFEWHGQVLYQSTREAAYRDAVRTLQQRGIAYECSCSRRQLAETEGPGASVYPGTCRNGPTRDGPTATRVRIDTTASIEFCDALQGTQRVPLSACGDVVVRRRDNVIAYQLAVVVDDAWQGITDVVRGYDLLASTPWQIALQRALGLDTPTYAHLPLITEPDGAKLAKSRRSLAIDPARAPLELCRALELLRQNPPAILARQSTREVWAWATANWRPQVLHRVHSVQLSPHGDSF